LAGGIFCGSKVVMVALVFGWLKLCIQNVVVLSKKDRPAFSSLLSPCLAGVFYGFSANFIHAYRDIKNA
jgi:hypothetical protein